MGYKKPYYNNFQIVPVWVMTYMSNCLAPFISETFPLGQLVIPFKLPGVLRIPYVACSFFSPALVHLNGIYTHESGFILHFHYNNHHNYACVGVAEIF